MPSASLSCPTSISHALLLTLLPPASRCQVHIEERAKPNGGLPLVEVRWIAAQLVLALEVLHGLRILHRDVKPSNVLMHHDGYVALTDFGLCGELPGNSRVSTATSAQSSSIAGRGPLGGGTTNSSTANSSSSSSSRCSSAKACISTGTGTATGTEASQSEVAPLVGKTGTRGYWAPEVIRKEPQVESADLWSLGVCLAYAATGVHPFHKRWVELGAAMEPPPPESVYVLAPAQEREAELFGAIEEALSSNAQRAPQRLAVNGTLRGAAGTPLAQATPSTPASPAELRGIPEEGMNYNSLFMPLELADLAHRVEPSLGEMISGMLMRDESARLGAKSGASELRAQPFFALTEWKLLEERRLPAPFLPSKEIVYAKDFIAPLSQDEVQVQQRAKLQVAAEDTEQPQLDLAGWRFVCGAEAFKHELAECASVVDPAMLLNTRAPKPATTLTL